MCQQPLISLLIAGHTCADASETYVRAGNAGHLLACSVSAGSLIPLSEDAHSLETLRIYAGAVPSAGIFAQTSIAGLLAAGSALRLGAGGLTCAGIALCIRAGGVTRARGAGNVPSAGNVIGLTRIDK